MVIVKRDGRIETFDPQKIQNAINAGNYTEAYSLIQENGTFGDTQNLYEMAQAGEAFASLDYETGIDHIYNIGGSVDVVYDTNGGTASNTTQTIKKSKYI